MAVFLITESAMAARAAAARIRDESNDLVAARLRLEDSRYPDSSSRRRISSTCMGKRAASTSMMSRAGQGIGQAYRQQRRVMSSCFGTNLVAPRYVLGGPEAGVGALRCETHREVRKTQTSDWLFRALGFGISMAAVRGVHQEGCHRPQGRITTCDWMGRGTGMTRVKTSTSRVAWWHDGFLMRPTWLLRRVQHSAARRRAERAPVRVEIRGGGNPGLTLWMLWGYSTEVSSTGRRIGACDREHHRQQRGSDTNINPKHNPKHNPKPLSCKTARMIDSAWQVLLDGRAPKKREGAKAGSPLGRPQ